MTPLSQRSQLGSAGVGRQEPVLGGSGSRVGEDETTRGELVGDVHDLLVTPPADTGKTVGLLPSSFKITFGFGPSRFERPPFGLAAKRPAVLKQLRVGNESDQSWLRRGGYMVARPSRMPLYVWDSRLARRPGADERPPQVQRRAADQQQGAFICFQQDPESQFVSIQRRLSQFDALDAYIKPVESAVFAGPLGASPAATLAKGCWREVSCAFLKSLSRRTESTLVMCG